MIKFIDVCEVWFLPESVARVDAIVGDHHCSRPSSFHKLRKLICRPGKQFNLVINEEPLDNACHRWSCIIHEIWLWSSPKGKERQLASTPLRCSASCLKYRQYVLEECESDIQYRPIP
ncbi:hypothetical protein TNCV_1915921 [Trichonephila clavipes]|uniref:Uncharacterized protein n=1 Tax=Trichonephila clavipes TaxID=2585209 RepID=A0A8X6W0L8_TRICX|nr:hypothetical protein TNCV_1915921 [Trichonephila clavipes]